LKRLRCSFLGAIAIVITNHYIRKSSRETFSLHHVPVECLQVAICSTRSRCDCMQAGSPVHVTLCA
ncbi:hypothetical protein GCK32_013783, partial [Trichostrongylus colubriformis]